MNIFTGGMKLFIIFLSWKKKSIGNQNMFFMEKQLIKIVMYIPVFVMDFSVHPNSVNYFSYIRWKNS